MKLYTEEQVKRLIAFFNFGMPEISVLDDLKLTPIELPSDVEIEKAANTQSHYEGAMWLKYKILNQNK
jgi:hypothetical protein